LSHSPMNMWRRCYANETFTSLLDGLHRVKLNVIIFIKKIMCEPVCRTKRRTLL